MEKKFNKSLFIFRRDLRLADNIGLNRALEQSNLVIPCFIFDPAQVGQENEFKSVNAIQFMIESLQELDEQLQKKGSKLYLFYGHQAYVIKQLIAQEKIDALFCNRDYTPFALKRDQEIAKVCHQNNCIFTEANDLLLHEPEDVKSGNGTPYTKFTPFWKKSVTIPVAKPEPLARGSFYSKPIKGQAAEVYKKILPKNNPDLAVNGGSKQGLQILKHIDQFKNYAHTHDIPSIATTHLSAHLKFGTISIRQAYWAIREALQADHPLLRQLYWRDFFTHIAYGSPFVFGQPFNNKFKTIVWKNNKNDFEAWCKGATGFPIVDAGMRQLNATGFMHNRVRMIVGSFLTKDLHINWLWGEKYFAQQLVDYDPSVNNGNWQWVASTGADAQPYFRIFNPWIQQKKFDPECTYIKQWVPELKNIDAKIIHKWFDPKIPALKNYPKPIVDHAKESKIALKMYKGVGNP